MSNKKYTTTLTLVGLLIILLLFIPTNTYAEENKTEIPPVSITPISSQSGDTTTLTFTMDALKKALDTAVAEAVSRGDNVLKININGKSITNSNSLNYILTKEALEELIRMRVSAVSFESANIKISFDATCMNSINRLSGGDVSLNIKRLSSDSLSESVKAKIGVTTMFDLSLIDNEGYSLHKLNGGRIRIDLATNGENIKNDLVGITVDKNDTVSFINDSYYKNMVTTLNLDNLAIVGVKQVNKKSKYTDISNHWAYKNIGYCVTRDIFKGVSETAFAPNNKITRGMFITVVGRLANVIPESYNTNSFSDVPSNQYYHGHVEWALQNKIITKNATATFSPNVNITREDMAVILKNYADYIGFELPKLQYEMVFGDMDKINPSAYESIVAIQRAGIMQGKDTGNFDPQGLATRAEVCAVIERLAMLAQEYGTSIFANTYVEIN